MRNHHTCPHCGCKKLWIVRGTNRKCTACRKEWVPRHVGCVSGFRYSRKQWRDILDTFLRDKTGTALVRECDLSQPTAYKITKRIQAVMAADVPSKKFSGNIEADATYIGGDWKNKRIHIRTQGTKRGRGTRKPCIFGIIQRHPQLVRVFLVTGENTRSVKPLVTKTVRKRSRVFTDECAAYQWLPKSKYRHQFVDHSKNEYVRGEVHTQTLDGYWGILKNFLANKGGVRHSELERFVSESVWRYNHRHLSRSEQVDRLLKLLTKK